jgi:hypothetical protein
MPASGDLSARTGAGDIAGHRPRLETAEDARWRFDLFLLRVNATTSAGQPARRIFTRKPLMPRWKIIAPR